MKKQIILFFLSLLLLLPIDCLAQQTDVLVSLKVKGDADNPAPDLLFGAKVVVAYPANHTVIGFNLQDRGQHDTTFFDTHVTPAARTVTIAVVNEHGWKQGVFMKISLTRSAAVQYSAVTGSPLGEAFKVLQVEVIDEFGNTYPAELTSAALTKFSWR